MLFENAEENWSKYNACFKISINTNEIYKDSPLFPYSCFKRNTDIGGLVRKQEIIT